MKKIMLGLLFLLTHNMAWASINHLVECSTCYSEDAFIIKAKLSYTGNGDAQEIYLFNPVTKTTRAYLVSGSGNPGRAFSPGLHVEPVTLTASQQQAFDELVDAYVVLKDQLLEPDTTVVIDEDFYVPGIIDPIGSIWDIVNRPNFRTIFMQTLFSDHTSFLNRFRTRLSNFRASIGVSYNRTLTLKTELPDNAWVIRYVLPDGSTLDVAFPPNQTAQIVAMKDSEGHPLFFPDQLPGFLGLEFDVENQGWSNYNEWRDFLSYVGYHFYDENDPIPANCVSTRVDINCREEMDENGHLRRVCAVKFTYECI